MGEMERQLEAASHFIHLHRTGRPLPPVLPPSQEAEASAAEAACASPPAPAPVAAAAAAAVDESKGPAQDGQPPAEPATSAPTTPTGTVLVHCQAGVSRSSTVVLYYMMRALRMSLRVAHERLLSVRGIARPNDDFFKLVSCAAPSRGCTASDGAATAGPCARVQLCRKEVELLGRESFPFAEFAVLPGGLCDELVDEIMEINDTAPVASLQHAEADTVPHGDPDFAEPEPPGVPSKRPRVDDPPSGGLLH